ncbi:hypothetical protein ACIBSV_20740 [Embleya sp. NPDC050154]|uniref:hypothetical protein n=1 Tax=unclassified Embleya TaxID=2699296 RepID=UPI002F90AACD|nr:hypothetical protein OG948_50600 [Embleya sp. NBC_00888]
MYQNHFRYSGARLLLTPFLHPVSEGIPVDPEKRAEALQPPLRVLWDRSERGGLTVFEAAAQIRAVGKALATGGTAEDQVPDDLQELARRSGAGGRPEVFLDVAEYVDSWTVGLSARLAGQIPTAWELRQRFGRLADMLELYFGQDGIALEEETLSDAEGIALYVEHTHQQGLCHWYLPMVVAECAEALALFPDDGALYRFFRIERGLGSGSHESWTAWLNLISDILTNHLRQVHGPVTWTGGSNPNGGS